MKIQDQRPSARAAQSENHSDPACVPARFPARPAGVLAALAVSLTLMSAAHAADLGLKTSPQSPPVLAPQALPTGPEPAVRPAAPTPKPSVAARSVPAFTPAPAIDALRADPMLKMTDFSAVRATLSDVAQVRAKAPKTDDGRYRVIVTLAQTFTPEGMSGPVAAEVQRSEIARSQSRVMEALADAGAGAEVTHRYSGVPMLAMSADARTLERLKDLPGIARIQPDGLNDPHLDVSVPLVGAADVFDRGFTGSGWTVAVVDTGIDRGHLFLRGFVDEACFSANSDCPNGQRTQTGAGAAAACTWSNDCFHGSHTSGIATGFNFGGMGTQSGGLIFDGVARGANLMPIRGFFQQTSATACSPRSAPCSQIFDSDIIAALDYVHGRRLSRAIAAVNLSLGGGVFNNHCDDSAIKPSVDNLRAAGIATVASSGNNGFAQAVGSPACISSVISVGATDDADNVAGFSNSAGILDLLAPGVGTLSSTSVPNGGFAFSDGTSMAAPHVAGAIALYKQRVDSSVDIIELFLKSTGKPVNDAGVPGGRITPRIRALHAMFINREALANGVERNHRLPQPNPHEYDWATASGGYSVVATRPSPGLDVDLNLFDVFDFTAPLGSSSLGGDAIDFVSVASRDGDFVFPLVQYFGGGNPDSRYTIEQVGPGAIFSHTLTRNFGIADVVSIADTNVVAFRQEWFRVVPHNGQDLELFTVDGAVETRTASTGASAAGSGGAEALSFVPIDTRRVGLVVTNRSGFGSYTLYRDAGTTLPAGTIVIDSGAATTADREVNLTLAITSTASGVADMRIATDGVMDNEAWQPFATSSTVTLPAGSGIKTVAVQLRSNAHAPGPVASDTIELTGGGGPSIHISNTAVTERDAGVNVKAKFRLTLSSTSTQTVTVSYVTANGTAISPGDYSSKTGTVSFVPGTTSKVLAVTVKGDGAREANETFRVNLSSAVNATIADSQGIGTINNDD